MQYSCCFLAAFALFLLGASPTVSFEDTGELLLATRGLGVTHPPGYPWYTLLGRLFMVLPAGDPAFRLNLMSAAFGAVAVTGVFAMVRLVRRAGPAPWLAAAALATSRTLWWQAAIAEKYTIAAGLMSLALLALLKAWLGRRPAHLALAAFLGGLSLSHHWHGLYLIPVTVVAGWAMMKYKVQSAKYEVEDAGPGTPEPARPSRARWVAVLIVLFAIPVLAKSVAIPIRAAADPEVNWGAPDEAGRWLFYLAARQYRFIMLAGKGPADVARRALDQAAVVPAGEFGPALALAAPGIAALRGTGLLPGVALALAANFLFAVSYDTPEIERYYLFSFAILAGLIGIGAGHLVSRHRAWAALVLAVPLAAAWRNGNLSPRSRHYLPYDFAVNQIVPLPPNALLICEGDDQAFPLFYVQGVLGRRTDVRIVPMPEACHPVAYGRFMRRYPDLVLPRFDPNPGVHLPRLIAANAPFRHSFYTPGCSGAGSERHLVPAGVVFEAHADPARAAAAARRPAPVPRLRLRGVMSAERYRDNVTLRAVGNYAFAIGYAGARAFEAGDLPGAERALAAALRVPADPDTRAMVLASLATVHVRTGKNELAEEEYREALETSPGFVPALLGLGKIRFARGDRAGARDMFLRAAAGEGDLPERLRSEIRAWLERVR